MKLVKTFVMTLCVALLVWISASYLNVISTNLSPADEPANWNFFTIMGKEVE